MNRLDGSLPVAKVDHVRLANLRHVFQSEVANRDSRSFELEMLELGVGQLGSKSELLFPPGTVTLVFCRNNDELSEAIRHAVTSDAEALETLAERFLFELVAGRQSVEIDPATVVRNASHLASLSYSSVEMVEAIIVAEERICGSVSIPYDGGPIDPQNFALTVSCRHSEELEINVLLVKRPPTLTEAEVAARSIVPTTESNVGLSSLSPVGFTPTAVKVGVFVFAAITFICPGIVTATVTTGRRRKDSDADSDDIENRSSAKNLLSLVSPKPAVDELFELRRRLITQRN